MASLIENLISVLEQENSEYEVLLELSRKKTPVIVKGDIERLQEITDEEQNIIDRIHALEGRQGCGFYLRRGTLVSPASDLSL